MNQSQVVSKLWRKLQPYFSYRSTPVCSFFGDMYLHDLYSYVYWALIHKSLFLEFRASNVIDSVCQLAKTYQSQNLCPISRCVPFPDESLVNKIWVSHWTSQLEGLPDFLALCCCKSSLPCYVWYSLQESRLSSQQCYSTKLMFYSITQGCEVLLDQKCFAKSKTGNKT